MRLILAMALASLMTLGFTQAAAPPTPDVPPKYVLGEKNNKQKIQLRVNETLEVRLPVNMSTGYSWRVQYSRAWALEARGEPKIVGKGDKDKTGFVQQQVFKFRAAEKGKFTIQFVHQRGEEWDNKNKRFKLTIEIKE
jgi:predicted secreted protein